MSKNAQASGFCKTGRFLMELGPKLSLVWRGYIYALHGFALEIFFTAIWELIENGNRKLHGLTSIYAFFIYGFSGVVLEKLSELLHECNVHILVRGLIYLAWSYAWEFSSGLFLRQFGACPWDYESYFQGHFMGLITLEYAPVWYLVNIIGEKYAIIYVKQLTWGKITKEKKIM